MAKQRVVYFDILNILATLCVVFMHTNSMVHHYEPSMAWKQALAVEVVCYWAVPVFFMLSGATLMRYREKYSTREFFKKRVLRTLVPFVVWSLINAVVLQITPFTVGWRGFIDAFFNTKIEPVYWYFIPLFSIYLAMPVLSLLADHRRVLWYTFGTTFLLISVCPFVFNLLGLQWNFALQMPMAAGCLMFTILGYLLATEDLKRWQRWAIYALGAFVAVLRFVATWQLSLRDGTLNRMFFNYTGFWAVLLAAAVFVLVRYLPLNNVIARHPRVTRLLSELSALSFGVYLTHMLILRVFRRLIVDQGYAFRLLLPFAVYAIAAACVWVAHKIPVLRKVL